jgi:hypothetical protein
LGCATSLPAQEYDLLPPRAKCSVEGSYETYTEDLRKRKGIDADQPHRVAYKKLVRA